MSREFYGVLLIVETKGSLCYFSQMFIFRVHSNLFLAAIFTFARFSRHR